MKIIQTFAISIIIVFIFAGCSQKQLPPPYPKDRDYAEPGQPPRSIDQTSPGVESGQIKSRPQPMALPDVSGIETDMSGQDPKVKPFSAGFVNDRILVYQNKLERWNQLDQQSTIANLDKQQTQAMVVCFRDLQRLLNGYQKLHNQIFEKDSGGSLDRLSSENIIALQRQDLAFLESKCGSLLSETGSDGISPMPTADSGSPAQIELMIADYYNNKAYEEVVKSWSQIAPYQQDRVNRKTALYYANALNYLNQPAKAAEVYQQIVDKLSVSQEQADDLLSLRKRLGDLYAASGNFFGAEGQYEQLSSDYAKIGRIDDWAQLQLTMLERSMKGSPELTDSSELLRSYLKFSPEKDGYAVVWKAEEFLQQYPYSPVSPNVDIIKEETMILADQWFANYLAEADTLVADKQYEEAIQLLQAVDQQKLSPENLSKFKEKLDSLVLADAVERETVEIEKMQALQTTWNEATALVESGDIDGGIEIFRQLLGSEYDSKAQRQIEELSLTSAKTERRKAADHFVRSTKTDDVENKKQLLVQSRQVLKDILVKYPEVEVADKVRGNIRTVEKKMNELDPMLLPELEQKEREAARMQESASDQDNMDGFDIESESQLQPQPSPSRTVLPVFTPQNIE